VPALDRLCRACLRQCRVGEIRCEAGMRGVRPEPLPLSQRNAAGGLRFHRELLRSCTSSRSAVPPRRGGAHLATPRRPPAGNHGLSERLENGAE
jgi:hypothetical protein